jgi:hypothetical protein
MIITDSIVQEWIMNNAKYMLLLIAVISVSFDLGVIIGTLAVIL